MAIFRTLAVGIAASALALAGCSSNRNSAEELMSAQIGVNAFLWRASLDTLDFMPLESADPKAGLIITEWYTHPEKPDERLKATVYILDTRLRADGLNVALFRQMYNGANWVDATIDPDTEIQLENRILSRARELKVGDFS